MSKKLEEIKKRLKEVRESTGMSQIDFAIHCGLKGQVITNLENGRQYPKFELIEKIAEKYPEYEDWILTGKEFPEAGQISPMTKDTAEKLKTS
ncbi:helix-turn-helix transcriptional regulator [Thiomicrorhabdus sp.]|uniref:helix-turn-helix domain-containing protein n=1 Tax=Thiomicrorhabdus sp. TaxID=2039724 RepID=UPI0029C9B13C|nr:helix-turn-helix transcriptional regulator [Thiomicrorhabdus sp.]